MPPERKAKIFDLCAQIWTAVFALLDEAELGPAQTDWQ
jgi:hypothetical protein